MEPPATGAAPPPSSPLPPRNPESQPRTKALRRTRSTPGSGTPLVPAAGALTGAPREQGGSLLEKSARASFHLFDLPGSTSASLV